MLHFPQVFDQAKEMADYDSIVATIAGPGRTQLEAIRAQVDAAYATYAASVAATQLPPIWSGRSTEAVLLRANYERLRSGARSGLGASILRRSKVCCLCGYSEAGQLDHHLPKNMFAEFAVLGLNLVPACGRCNLKKRDVYLRSDGGAAFLHAYRDILPPGESFLQVTVSISATVIANYDVVRPPSMTVAVFETLQSHFAGLELADLYGNLASEVMVEKVDPFYAYFDDGGAGAVETYLRRDAMAVAQHRGINHWRAALLFALADDPLFCMGGFERLGPRTTI